MPAIRVTGMASGLPPNIVDQIMEAEKIPVKQMEQKKAVDEDKLKLVGDLSTKVSDINKSLTDLVGLRGFSNNKLSSGDPNILNGTLDPDKSVTGSWEVEVLQLAEKPGAVTNGFPDRDKTHIGTGYIKFQTPSGTKEVYLNGKTNTLDKVAAEINGSGTGLRATVLNDRSDKQNPFRLLVTGMTSGDDNEVHFPTIYMLDGDQDIFFEKTKDAKNAKVKLDGFEVEVPENNVKDMLPGVNLELKQAAPGRPISINVKEDYEAISGKLKTFVDSANGVLGFIQNQHKLTKDKEGRQRMGPLGGDGLLRTVESTMRRIVQSEQHNGGPNSTVTRLTQLGVEFSRNGTLTFNQDKFNKALTSDAVGVAQFLRGDGYATGFIPMVTREVNNLANGTSGPLTNRKKGIEDRIKDADDRIGRKESQLEKKEESLRRKFADLESTMSGLQSQGAQLGGLAGGRG